MKLWMKKKILQLIQQGSMKKKGEEISGFNQN